MIEINNYFIISFQIMAVAVKDVKVPENAPTELLMEKHIDFLVNYGKEDTHYEYVMAEFLRISGVYWSYTALHLMDAEQRLSKKDVSGINFLSPINCAFCDVCRVSIKCYIF